MSSELAQRRAGLHDEHSIVHWERGPIVCFANDWKGDPTSKHHIMRIYSTSTDVLWVESAGMRRPKLLAGRDLRRIVDRVRKAARWASHGGDRVHVVSPLGIPLPGSDIASKINGLLYRRAVRRAAARLEWDSDPLLWVFTPTVSGYLQGMRRRGLVYHCVDRWWEFKEYDRAVMLRHHVRLCEEADVVFASAQALLDDCRPHSKNAYLIPHGVDWEHFASAACSPQERPSDMADIRGPVIGFFGLIQEWIDQELIYKTAIAFPHATIVLIGRAMVDVGRLTAVPNIRLLGQRSYDQLPAYCAAFDVGIIPFVLNDLTAAVNPIKLREYLSAGIPTVASALPEVRLLQDHPRVRVGENAEEFIAAVQDFLETADDRDSRRKAALEMSSESWVGRCAEMARLIHRHVP